MFNVGCESSACTTKLHVSYTHTFENATSYTVNVTVEYVSLTCKNDNFDLAPGHIKTISAGICIVRKVGAKVYVKGGFDEEKIFQASPYKGPFTGSMSWQVTGPVENKYSVVRKVQ